MMRLLRLWSLTFAACSVATGVFADGLAVAPPQRTDAVRFEDEVRPFLAANCTACHNEKIKEGGLRLDSQAALVAGGDSGPGVVAGKSAESLVFLRATHRQDDAMPPADNKVGARNLTPEQLGILQRWIDEGATPGPAATRRPIAWRPVPPGTGGVMAVAMSADGRVTAASRAGRVSLFDTQSGRLLGTLVDPAAAAAGDAAHADTVQSLAISAADERIASGSFRTVKIWRRDRPAKQADVADSANASAVAVAANLVAVGRGDGSVVLADATTGAVVRTVAVHAARVTGVAFSPDAATLFTSGQDNGLAAVNVADGTITGRLVRPGPVAAVACLGGQLAAADADGVVRIWPLPLPAPGSDPAAAPPAIKEFNGGGQPVTALAVPSAPPGHLLAGGADGVVRLWSIEAANVVRQFAHGGAVTGIAVRPDGGRLATVGTIPGVKVWDAANGQMTSEWKGDHRLIERLRLVDIDVAVRKQDVEYGKARVTDAEKAVEAAAAETKSSAEKMAAAEKTLAEKTEAEKTAMVAKDEAAKAAATADTEVQQATDAHAVAMKSVAAAVAAVEAATAGANAFTTVATTATGDAAAAETLKTFQAVAAAANAAKTAADQAMVQAAQQIERSKTKAGEMKKKADEMAKAATAAADAKKAAETGMTSAQRGVEFAAQQTARAAEALPQRKDELVKVEAAATAADQARAAAEAARVAAEKPIAAVTYSTDGGWIVATSPEGVAVLLDGQDGLPRDAWDATGEGGRSLAAFVGPGRVFVGGGATAAGLWTCSPHWTLERTIGGESTPPASDDEPTGPPVDIVTSLAFSPDGGLLATGSGRPSRSGEVKLWNVADGGLVRALPSPHSDTVVALEFSRTGDLLASGGTDRFVKVHKVADGSFLRAFEGHTGHVLGVAWQANGRRLASAGADNAIKVWDVVSGEQQRTIGGLKKEATAIRFLPPGEEVVAASGDPSVRTYNVANGGTVRNFDGAADFVQAIATGPTAVAAGCQDGRVRIWNAASGQLTHTLEPSPAPQAP